MEPVMRLPLILAALAVAGPALAQTPVPPQTPFVSALNPGLSAAIAVQQETARQQAIQQQNQIVHLNAQRQTEQAIASLQAIQDTPLPPQAVAPAGSAPRIDAGQLPSIPDSALAQSNKRVLDAASGH
jgi:hypothetical protein